MFGIGIGAQGNGHGDILKQIERAMEFDGSGAHGIEAARKHLRQRIVKGKRTAILNDDAIKFTKGLASFEAQHFHAQFAHHVTQ
jgi:hypothetical protein